MISGIGALNSNFFSGGLTDSVTAPASTGVSAGQSFASMVSQAASDSLGNLQNAETMSVKALAGDVQTRDVVDAVMSAEQSLQAAIAIRDKIVSAYMEVSRMAI